jgi:hypothetical protein
MQDHEHFEELCALAAVGQLSGEEYREFQGHLGTCSLCREALDENAFLTDSWTPATAQLNDGIRSLQTPSTTELRRKFITRARDRGINLTRQSETRPAIWTQWPLPSVRPYFAATLAVACVVAMAMVLIRIEQRISRATQEVQALRDHASNLQRETISLKEKIASQTRHQIGGEANTVGNGDELAKLREQRATATAKVTALESSMAAVSANRDEIQQQLDKARADLAQMTENYSIVSRELASARSELESARTTTLNDKAALLAQSKRIEELWQHPSVPNGYIERERELLAADRDIRELMGARNLHIIDVHDRDLKGKARRSFGRVFYTEGKSLIFYAFDLSDPNLKDASFQAWGHKEDGSRKEVSLGLFYMDDKQQSRWVLRFNDPAVLAEIDSVFVTVEPLGGRKTPSGEKLLYAFLNLDANHP